MSRSDLLKERMELQLSQSAERLSNGTFSIWKEIGNFLILLLELKSEFNIQREETLESFREFYMSYNPFKDESWKIFDDFMSNLSGEIPGKPWATGPDIWLSSTTSAEISFWFIERRG